MLRRVTPALIGILAGLLLADPLFPHPQAPAAPALAQMQAVLDGDDRWGINHTFADATSQRAAREAGARWNRWEFRWGDIEQTQGRSNYASYDRMLDSSLATGLTVQGILINTPEWARDPQNQLPRGLYLSWNDNNNLWGRFVRDIATRYKGKVQYWEAWNEPDLADIFWPGTVADYYQLLKITYLAVKSVDPSAQVLMGGLAHFPNPAFLGDLLRLMRADPLAPSNNYFFDVLVWHSYSRPSDSFDLPVNGRRQLVESGIGTKPIWINETNVPAWDESPVNNFRPYGWSSTTQEQASYVIQSAAYGVAGGAHRIFVYRMQDTEWPEAYGLLRGNGTHRPAYTAMQVATRYLSHVTAVNVARQGDVEQVVLRRNDERVNVVWNRTRSRLTARLGGLATGATVVDQTGATRSIRPAGGQYELDLAPATANNGVDANDFHIGGPPLIIVESLRTGQQTIEETNSMIGFAGTWERPGAGPVAPGAPEPSGGGFSRHATAGYAVAVEFSGPSVTWVTSKGPDRGHARVEVDGTLIAEIDLYNPQALWDVPLTFGDFSSGNHRMVITVLGQRSGGSSNSFVDVDAFIGSGFRQASPPPTPTPLPTPSPTMTPTPTPTPTITPTLVQTATPTPVPTPPPGRPQAAAYGAPSDPSTRFVLPLVMRERNGWNTFIALQNRGTAPAPVNMTFLDDAGAQIASQAIPLAAEGSHLLDPRVVAGLSDGFVGAAVVESTQPVAATVREYRDDVDALGYGGTSSGSDRAYIPLIFNGYNGWDSGVQVQNVGNDPVPVTITYRQSNGQGGPWTDSGTVPPQAAMTFYQPAHPDLPSGFVGSAIVEAPAGSNIVAVVNEVHEQGAGMSYEGATSGRPTVNAPLLFRNANGWNTGLQVQNVGSEEAEVIVTYRATDGGPWYEAAWIAPGSSFTFYQPASDVLPNGFVGSAVATSVNQQPLVGIVNETNALLGVAMTYRAMTDGAPVLSVPSLARRAESGWSTGVQVQNLGAATTSVAFRLRGPDGGEVRSVVESVPAGDSRTFYLPAMEGVNDGWRGAGTLVSEPPQPLGAIINETRY